MAKSGEIGTIIPEYTDIIKIDGDNLVDVDGDEFNRDLIMVNNYMGGGFELVKVD